MKKLSALCLAGSLASTPVLANECNMELNANLKVTPASIQIFDNKDSMMEIRNSQQLFINGNEIELNDSQLVLVQGYADGVKGTVPQVAEIAIDAIQLATVGIDKAFGELLGKDSSGYQELMQSMDDLKDYVATRFQDGENFVIHTSDMEGNDFLGNEFEEKLSQNIESAVQKSIGSLLITVGKEMLFSGGNMEAFERRMDNFGKEIEREIEGSAQLLEVKAENLCRDMYELELMENQLQQHIPQMTKFDLFEIDYSDRT